MFLTGKTPFFNFCKYKFHRLICYTCGHFRVRMWYVLCYQRLSEDLYLLISMSFGLVTKFLIVNHQTSSFLAECTINPLTGI